MVSRKGFSAVKDKNTYMILKKAEWSWITSIDAQMVGDYRHLSHASRKLKRLYNWGLLSRRRMTTRAGGRKYLYEITLEGKKYIEWYEKG